MQGQEHEAPGDLLNIDTKNLGRIVRPGHRITGDRRDGADSADYARLGVGIKRLLTDNGAAFRPHDLARDCQALGIKHRFTRAYRPRTNG